MSAVSWESLNVDNLTDIALFEEVSHCRQIYKSNCRLYFFEVYLFKFEERKTYSTGYTQKSLKFLLNDFPKPHGPPKAARLY